MSITAVYLMSALHSLQYRDKSFHMPSCVMLNWECSAAVHHSAN